MYRGSRLRSTLNTSYITGSDMCKVCTDAADCVAFGTGEDKTQKRCPGFRAVGKIYTINTNTNKQQQHPTNTIKGNEEKELVKPTCLAPSHALVH